jgi:hypothetical protein
MTMFMPNETNTSTVIHQLEGILSEMLMSPVDMTDNEQQFISDSLLPLIRSFLLLSDVDPEAPGLRSLIVKSSALTNPTTPIIPWKHNGNLHR